MFSRILVFAFLATFVAKAQQAIECPPFQVSLRPLNFTGEFESKVYNRYTKQIYVIGRIVRASLPTGRDGILYTNEAAYQKREEITAFNLVHEQPGPLNPGYYKVLFFKGTRLEGRFDCAPDSVIE